MRGFCGVHAFAKGPAANRAAFCMSFRLVIIGHACLVAWRIWRFQDLERRGEWVNNKPGGKSSSLVRTLRDHKSRSRPCQFCAGRDVEVQEDAGFVSPTRHKTVI